MPQLSPVMWFKNGRRPVALLPPFPFKEEAVLSLRDKVSRNVSRTDNVPCVAEMMKMLSCFKANDYDQSNCLTEIELFKKCESDFTKARIEAKQKIKSELPVGAKVNELTKLQANALLARYPLKLGSTKNEQKKERSKKLL